MAKYNTTSARPAAAGPVKTETVSSVKTHEGGAGFLRDAKGELFLRATASFAGEDSFYEDKFARDDRIRAVAAGLAVTGDGMEWLSGFLPWLRTAGYMRSAPVLLAAEVVHARLAAGLAGGNRQLIASVLKRADEPGEFLAYWRSRFGRGVPMAVQRGVADAAIGLYTEFSLLKYDTPSKGIRFGDVLEITHAGDRRRSAQHLKGAWQHDLFRYAIDRRHDRGDLVVPESLGMIRRQSELSAAALDDAEQLLDADALKASGMTWEKVSSLAGSKVSKAAMWEAKIPSMGYLALLRNLRNFDDAKISDAAAAQVTARLADPGAVAKSMVFPYQFYAAWAAVKSLRWGPALETALTLSTGNIPELAGRTLVLIDTSASMNRPMSGKSKMTAMHAAAIFGLATAARSSADVHGFADGQFRLDVRAGASVLRSADQFVAASGRVGHGTRIADAVRATYAGHDRVMVFTDMQTFPASPGGFADARGYGYDPYGRGDITTAVPPKIPVYGFNLVGYAASALSGAEYHHELGGLTDATFRLIPQIEMRQAGRWPWEE
jgi:TROVE domain